MRIHSLLFVSAACCLSAANFTISDVKWGGMILHIEDRLEPSDTKKDANLRGGVTTNSDGLHRLLVDSANKRYLGYSLTVQPIAGTDRFRLQFGPLRMTADELAGREVLRSWTAVSPAKYPTTTETRISETLAVDLLVNPGTGQKIVDYITLIGSGGTPNFAAARDFSVADVMLELDRPQVKVNGTLVKATREVRTSVSGSAVWLYLPDRGRVVFTLLPHHELGLQLRGEVNGQDALIKAGADTYEITCARRIAPAPGKFNLYVLQDAGWRPRGADVREPFLFGAADKVEWLIRR